VLDSPAAPWPHLAPEALAAVLAMGVAAWLGSGVVSGSAERVPRAVLLAVLAISAAGVAIAWIVPAVAGTPGAGASPGAVATIRTAALVSGAVLLAWLGRAESWPEARWLAYPVLAMVGLKILLEDLPRSRPATLFVAFACYGAALIVVPRFRRREPPSASAPAK
jgi:hypothetical protein